jgi:hypothetical protein
LPGISDGAYPSVVVIVIVEIKVVVGTGGGPSTNNSDFVWPGGSSSHSELKINPLHSRVLRHNCFALQSDRGIVCVVVSTRLVSHR